VLQRLALEVEGLIVLLRDAATGSKMNAGAIGVWQPRLAGCRRRLLVLVSVLALLEAATASGYAAASEP
jgi:hypothetical protein